MSALFYRFLREAAGLCGPWLFEVTARLIACGYFLFSPRRAESLRFYRILFPEASLGRRLLLTLRQYQNFTTIHLDRFLHEVGRPAQFTSSGWEQLEEACQEGGAILLMSHLGNWEMAATLLKERHQRLRLLLYMGVKEGEAVEGMQKNELRRDGVEIIGVDRGRSSPFAAVEALRLLREGGLVSIAADIVWRDEQRQVKVPFLGGVARLPAAPFILAQLSGRPLFVFFAFRIGANRYQVPLSAPMYVDKGPRQGRQQAIATAAGRYATLLEEAVRRHPGQWYHFDRFVHEGEAGACDLP